MSRTPIKNLDEKLDIIEHLNNEHGDELLVVANYYGQQDNYEQAIVKDMFEEGVVLQMRDSHDTMQELFVAFTIRGSLEERVLYLAFYAMTKQGLRLTGNRRKFFEVIGTTKVSKHMLRIDIKSSVPLPRYYAGYTYGFLLRQISPAKRNRLEIKDSQLSNDTAGQGFLARQFNHFFIWLLRVMSSKRRIKMIETMNRDLRLYTLRIAKVDPANNEPTLGAVDVYLHDHSPGGQWARNLKPGDIIFSRTEVPDRHEYMREGRQLLIGDESAYPAIAGLLELWQNPLPPTVLILIRDEADKAYFDEVVIPPQTEIIYFKYKENQQAGPILDYLKTVTELDGAWGGLERAEAKQIRHYIRHQLQIEGAKNHVKAYWVAKAEDEL